MNLRYFFCTVFSFLMMETLLGQNTFPVTGNVGIGISNPVSPLHVNGEIRSRQYVIDDNSGNVVMIGAGGIDVVTRGAAPKSRSLHYEVASPWDASQVQLRAGSTYEKNTVRLQTSWNGQGLDNLGGIYFGLRSTDTHVMLSNGNVGIGTLTPNEKLAVNGNIRAKEIKVEATNWPDYVFSDKYQLPTLQETSRFIAMNKHLPGVPKASEIEASGLELGEMNKILMQKVEELTLHLIEKDKEIQSLKTLEDRVNILESLLIHKK